jgi:hypothetical protein
MTTRSSVAESDETKDLVRRVISAMEQADPEGRGKTVRELFDLIKQFPEDVPLLSDVVNEVCQGALIPKRFSKKLISIKGRIVDGKRIESENAGGGIKRWRVVGGWLGGLGGFETKEVYARNQVESGVMGNDLNRYTYTGQAKSNQPNQPNQPCDSELPNIVSGVI